MAHHNRLRFVHGQVAWMSGAAILLLFLDSLTYQLFFVISFIGFLIMMEFTAPFAVSVRWRKRLRLILLLGLIVFAYIIVTEIVENLPPGVF